MLYKVCFHFTILIVLFSSEAELRIPVAKKGNVDDKAVFSDVIKNITRVNTVLEDLIKNYEKLKTLYKSEETIDDYSSDDEVDEVYKQKKRLRAKGIVSTPSTTKNPNNLATQMFFSEEHANEDGYDTNASDLENNEQPNNDKPTREKLSGDKPKNDKLNNDKRNNDRPNNDRPNNDRPNNDKPYKDKFNSDKPINNKLVIKIPKKKQVEKEREMMPQVEFLVQGSNSKTDIIKSTIKIEPKTDQPEKLKQVVVLQPFSAKYKPQQASNETVVIIKDQEEAVTRGKLPSESGKMKLIARLRPEAEGEKSRDSGSVDSTFVGNSGSFTEGGSSEERPQNQDERYSTSDQQSFESEKYKLNRNRQEKTVSPTYKSKKLKQPINNTTFRTVKKVIKAEEFSYDKIWDEVLHKPVQLDTQKEIVYYKQPKIYFRNQITPETTWQYKEVTLEPSFSEEKPRTKTTKKRVQKKPGHTAQSLEDEKTIMKEQFKTRILRKAYGDACLKVVVKKCYKACKSSTKRECKKYNCKAKFKAAFESSAKTNCIKEFKETSPGDSRKNEGPYDRQFQDITRDGYLAAACLPTAKTERPETEKGKNNTRSKTDSELNHLRDRFEKACQKVSSDKCTKACENSYEKACEEYDCSGGRKSAFKKSCRKECKSAYRSSNYHSKHKDKSSSDTDSDSGSSRSSSDSDPETDFDLDDEPTKKKKKDEDSDDMPKPTKKPKENDEEKALIKKIVVSRIQNKNKTNVARYAPAAVKHRAKEHKRK